MTSKGLVSIIIAVYNGEEFIAQAIDSVINQTYQQWELIIVNDGSTDGTLEEISHFEDSRIAIIDQENRGVSAARNRGLERMKGEFFCFLDADDRLSKKSLEVRVVTFQKDLHIEFVDGKVHIYDVSFKRVIEERVHSFSGNPLAALCAIDMSCFFGPTWMIRRSSEKAYQFKEGLTHGEDLLFYMSLAKGGMYVAVPVPIYEYRSGNISAMSNIKALGRGYEMIYTTLKHYPHVSETNAKKFRLKSKKIMLRTYLRFGYFISALKLLFK